MIVVYRESPNGKVIRVYMDGELAGAIMYVNMPRISHVGWQYVPDGSRLSASKVFVTVEEAKRFVEML